MSSELASRIQALFNVSSAPQERALDEQLDGSIQEFLETKAAGSEVELVELSRQYSSTELPATAVDVRDYFATLTEGVVPNSDRVASPRYIGHMTSALPFFVRPISRLLTALNQNLVKIETSKALTPYERESLGIMHRIVYGQDDAFYQNHLQDRASTLAIMTSGGTLANTTALWIARNASMGPPGAADGVEAVGMAEALQRRNKKRAVIVGSSLMHYSLEKAADILGVGRQGFVKVPTDAHSRIDVTQTRRTLQRCKDENDHVVALIGIAGTTDSGTIDPLNELADLAAEMGVHFHVDAAWGGPLVFSRTHRHLLDGIERADSITIDGHKQLYLPMGMGICLLKDPHIAKSIEKQAQYIIRADSADLGKRALEGSRGGSALYLHAALHIIGRDGYEYLIDEGIRKARHMAAAIRRRPEYELLVEPEINIVNYRYVPTSLRDAVTAGKSIGAEEHERANAINRRVQELQHQRGRSFISRTTLRLATYAEPVVAFRSVLANPLTTEVDIDAVLDESASIAASLDT